MNTVQRFDARQVLIHRLHHAIDIGIAELDAGHGGGGLEHRGVEVLLSLFLHPGPQGLGQ